MQNTPSSIRKPGGLRFSLRGLLLLITGVCLFLGWRTYQESKLRRIEQRLNELRVPHKMIREAASPWQRLLGPATYTRIDRIHLKDPHFHEARLEEIVNLSLSWGGVREVVFDNVAMPVPDSSYEEIGRLSSLERIVFDYCEPRDVEAMKPLARLPRLKEISIEITWGKSQPFPFDFYLSLPSLKILGLPSWSNEEQAYVARRRPDIELQITDFPP